MLGLALLAVVPRGSTQTSPGLAIQLYPGLTITGAVGTAYSIQCVPNLAQTNDWLELTNLTLTSSSQLLFDTAGPAAGQRFYRAVSAMVLIPAGSFQMGDSFNEGDTNEIPVHAVSVGAFYMDRFKVTKAFWDEVYQWATNHGYSFDNAGSGKAANHPVHTVSWYDVVKWCNARSEKEGRVPAYYTSAAQTTVYRSGQVDVQNDWVKWNAGYRLPTEAEWEKAARGGLSGKRFPWGDTITHSQANYFSDIRDSYDLSPTRGDHPTYSADGESPYTSPMGSFGANGYGLYGMAGNVWVWCWDWHDGLYYGISPGTDPKGPAFGDGSTNYRVRRGGSYYREAYRCRTASRYNSRPFINYGFNGFRSVLPPGQP